jgi:hypothetical protein
VLGDCRSVVVVICGFGLSTVPTEALFEPELGLPGSRLAKQQNYFIPII